MTEQTMLDQLARAIAKGLGDNFDHAFATKGDWTAARGEKGGRYRDINEARQSDYLEAARAGLATLRTPTEDMLEAGLDAQDEGKGVLAIYQVMIDAAGQGLGGEAGPGIPMLNSRRDAAPR